MGYNYTGLKRKQRQCLGMKLNVARFNMQIIFQNLKRFVIYRLEPL